MDSNRKTRMGRDRPGPDRHRERQTGSRQTQRDRPGARDRQRGTERDRQTDGQTQTERQRETERQTERDTQRETHRETEGQTERDTHRERQSQRGTELGETVSDEQQTPGRAVVPTDRLVMFVLFLFLFLFPLNILVAVLNAGLVHSGDDKIVHFRKF